MALALLWLSNGWTITVTTLGGCLRLGSLAVTLLLTAVYVAFFIIEVVYRDPAAAYAPHEGNLSRGGIVPLRIVLGMWFATNVRRILNGKDITCREQRQGARSFYRVLLASGTLWFVSLPAWHGLCALLPPWQRHKAMTALLATSNWLSTAMPESNVGASRRLHNRMLTGAGARR